MPDKMAKAMHNGTIFRTPCQWTIYGDSRYDIGSLRCPLEDKTD
jgi:hypothetical protein